LKVVPLRIAHRDFKSDLVNDVADTLLVHVISSPSAPRLTPLGSRLLTSPAVQKLDQGLDPKSSAYLRIVDRTF
jgi:hypothetical protein